MNNTIYKIISIIIPLYVLFFIKNITFINNSLLMIDFKGFLLFILSLSSLLSFISILFFKKSNFILNITRLNFILVIIIIFYSVVFFLFSDNLFPLGIIPLYTLPLFVFLSLKNILNTLYVAKSIKKLK